MLGIGRKLTGTNRLGPCKEPSNPISDSGTPFNLFNKEIYVERHIILPSALPLGSNWTHERCLATGRFGRLFGKRHKLDLHRGYNSGAGKRCAEFGS